MVKPLHVGKFFIFSWLNLYFLAKPLFFHGKIFTSQQNLYFFLVKPLLLGKNFNYFWLNLYLLTKLQYFRG